MNINMEKMFDDNDKPYAVLKVKTENINDEERRKLLFEGDARTYFEVEYKVGEVWVYISYYATYLKISHPDFGSTEYMFPIDMKGKKGYELTILNKKTIEDDLVKRLEALENATATGANTGEYGYVVIRTTPVNGATVLIDGDEMEMKTPFVSDKLSIGHHRIRVIKDHYKPYVTIVEIEEGKTINLDVVLEQAFGSLEIVTQPENANIKINRIEKGTTPKTFDRIQAGDYKIELSKKKYQTVVKDVSVNDGETTLVEVEMEKIPTSKSLRKTGWVIRPEIGAGGLEFLGYYNYYFIFYNCFIRHDDYITNDYYGNISISNFSGYDHFNLNTNIGYQFNPYCYLGVSLGLDLNNKASMLSMPICLNPRLYFNDRKTSLYFDIKLGMSINIKSSDCPLNKDSSRGYYYSNNGFEPSTSYEDFITITNNISKISGLTGSFEIGFEHRHSSFAIAFCIQNIYFETSGYNHYYSFSDDNVYTFNDIPTIYNNNIFFYNAESMFYSLMLKYGYTIFGNKK